MSSWTTAISLFLCFCICAKLVSSDLSRSPPPFYAVLCVTFMILFSDLNFNLRITSTASCSVFGYLLFLIVYLMEKSCINHTYFILSYPIIKTIFDHASNEFFFVLIVSSASFTSSSFLNYLVILTKPSIFFSNKTFTVPLSCLNLSMYSTNLSLSYCLVFIIIARYSINDRYGYVACIGSCIEWSIVSISFKGFLIILSYSGAL